MILQVCLVEKSGYFIVYFTALVMLFSVQLHMVLIWVKSMNYFYIL